MVHLSGIAFRTMLLVVTLAVLAAAQAVADEASVRLSGRVTVPGGGLAAGAAIVVLNPQERSRPIGETTADAEGCYSIDLPSATYRVIARFGVLIAVKDIKLNADGSTRLWYNDGTPRSEATHLALEEGCMVMGIVVDTSTGALVSDADVVTYYSPNVKTDKAGVFSLLVPMESLDIRVSKPGYATAAIRFFPNNQGVAALKIETRPGGVLRGTVKDQSGKPIEGATVRSDRNDNKNLYAKTDSEGRYLIDGLDPGQVNSMHVDAAGYEARWREEIIFPGGSREAVRDFQLRETDKRSITGRVTSEDGSPVKGALVLYGSGSNYVDNKSARTDESGCYVMTGVEPRANIVTARAPGFAPTFEFVPEKVNAELDFVLQPGHTLEGRVVDQEGRPVVGEGISVNAECTLFDRMNLLGHNQYRWIAERVSTDADGYFRVDDMPPGKVYIETFFRDYARIDGMPLPVDEKYNVITLSPMGRISGVVVSDADGKPISSFTVSNPRSSLPVAFSSPDGVFTMRTSFQSPGSVVSLTVAAPGYRSATVGNVKVLAEPQAGYEDVVFRLKPARPFVGRVTDASGKPLEGALVTLLNSRFGSSLYWGDVDELQVASARTDASGSFTMEDVPYERGSVVIRGTGYARRLARNINLSAPLEVSLEEGASITAEARDRAGSVIGDAHISIRSADSGITLHAIRPDARGMVVVDDLPAGRYIVSRSDSSKTQVVHEAEISAGQRYVVNWNRRNPVTVEGRFTQGGMPAADATVLVHNNSGNIVAHAKTDEAGRYSTSLYRPGAYSVMGYKGEWRSPEHTEYRARVELKKGKNRVDGRLPGASISGVLLDAQTGSPIAGAAVASYQKATGPSSAKPSYHWYYAEPGWWPRKEVATDSEGRFTLPSLEEGEWMLAAVVGEGEEKSTLPGPALHLKGDERKAGIELRVDPSATGSASVTLTAPSGETANETFGFMLSARGESGLVYHPKAEPRGSFGQSWVLKKAPDGGMLFDGLPAGRYTLFVPASASGPAGERLLATTKEFEISAGEMTSVSVTLRQGSALVFRLPQEQIGGLGGEPWIGYKVLRAGSKQPVMEDPFGRRLGGEVRFGAQGGPGRSVQADPTLAVIPLPPGDYMLEAVLRIDPNNALLDDPSADVWTTRTEVRIEPGRDCVIDIDLSRSGR